MYPQTYHVVLVLLCCISICVSFFLVALLSKRPKLRRRQGNKIFFSYLIAGVLASIFRTVYHASMIALDRKDLRGMQQTVENFIKYKGLFTVIDNTNVLLTLSHLLLLSVERFTAIKFSYFYQRHATNSFVYKFIGGIWAFALILLTAYLLMIFLEHGRYCFRFLNVTNMIWIITGICFLPASNIIIVSISWKQIKSIQKLQVGTPTNNARESRQELQAALICSLIVFNFLVVWCPVLVSVIQVYWFHCWCHALTAVCSFLVVIGSITDSLIYAVFNKEIREEIRVFFRCDSHKEISSKNKETSSNVSVTQDTAL